MYVSRRDEKILAGEEGWAKAKAMEVIVKLGDALGAKELVNVAHVHISGVSYLTIGDAGLEFLKELAESGAKFSVPATVNPVGYDVEEPQLFNISEDFFSKQSEILSALKSMGARITLSCIPYEYITPSLKPGTHVAWGESNAVFYANTVLGLVTNREGAPLTVLAAIVGKVPKIGIRSLHVEAVEARISAELKNPLDWGLAGFAAGKLCGRQVPKLSRRPPCHECMKSFGAACATAAPIPLALIDDVTPKVFKYEVVDKVEVDDKAVMEVLDELSVEGDVDAGFVGCPHTSLPYTIAVCEYILKIGKRLKKPLYISTYRTVKELLKAIGYVDKLRRLNVYIVADTCLVVSPALRSLGIKRVCTNSVKSAYYLRRMHGVEVVLDTLEGCVRRLIA